MFNSIVSYPKVMKRASPTVHAVIELNSTFPGISMSEERLERLNAGNDAACIKCRAGQWPCERVVH